jgi:hypothetical protein
MDPGGTRYATTTEVKAAAANVARSVPVVMGALLFAQRQMREINDPARHTAVDRIARACQDLRENRLAPAKVDDTSRVLAVYRIDIAGEGGFRIDVDSRLMGTLHDAGGQMATAALAEELLATLPGPYRVFYLEMLEAVVAFWRAQRPSPIDTSWNWTAAFRRLGDLTRSNTEAPGPSIACKNCQAVRPVSAPCLHCGAPPEPIVATDSRVASATTTLLTPPPTWPIPAPPTAQTPISTPMAPLVPTAPAASPVTPPAPIPTTAAPLQTGAVETAPGELSILPANTLASQSETTEIDERDTWPAAGFVRRFGSWFLDLVSGLVLGVIGAVGVVSLLVAAGAISTSDDITATAPVVVAVVLALYLGCGWYKGETLGMRVMSLRLLRFSTRRGCNVYRSFLRGLGALITLAIGLAVLFGGMWLDDQLIFIQGTADTIVRVVVLILALYAVWLGSGQQILSAPGRQSLADKVADTIVVHPK